MKKTIHWIILLSFLSLLHPIGVKSAERPNWIPSEWIQLTTNPYYDALPSWSADGNEIIFTAAAALHHPKDIWIMNADCTNKRQLTNLGTIEAADLSPDGLKITFSYGSATNSIAIMDYDGKNIHDIYSIGSSHIPRWSPAGNKITFHSETESPGNPTQIFIINPDGSGLTQLTTDGDCYFPSWSPDGSKIAYQKGHADQGEIYAMDADGSNKKQLTNMPGEARAVWPVWSPNGKISFLSDFEGQVDIYMMNEDGINIVRLTNTPGTWGSSGEEYDHEWSPDGKWIALSEHIEGTESDIYLAPITPPPDNVEEPLWSQWWFWAIVALVTTTSVFAFTTIHYRKKAPRSKKPQVISAEPESKTEHRICPNCGAKLPTDSEFCGKCGNSLK